jgi:hypothetical protein
MEQWVLWLMAIPAFVVLYYVMVFLLKRLSLFFGNYYHNKAVHLVILTYNSQRHVEWTVWSYQFWNGTKGRKGYITCIDTGSIDDTLAILQRLQQRYPHLKVKQVSSNIPQSEEAIKTWLESQNQHKEKLVVLDLREWSPAKEPEKHLA